MIAEFEADLARARVSDMAVAHAKGRLRRKQFKLTPRRAAQLVRLAYRAGGHSIAGSANR